MTVVVALKEPETGKVWIGSDKYRSFGSHTIVSVPAKVWAKKDSSGNNWVFGACGSLGIHQVARYQVPLPTEDISKVEDAAEFIYTKWVIELYKRCKDVGGTIRRDGNTSEALDGQVLIGVGKEIYMVAGVSIAVIDRSFHTIGSGYQAAYGALDALERHRISLSPAEQIESAIAAATSLDPDVGGGMDIVNT